MIKFGSAVALSAALVLGGGLAVQGVASASVLPDRGIVCPRGQHGYHAPGGAVSCIPNGQSTATPKPTPAPAS
jgi:hypothetical protein